MDDLGQVLIVSAVVCGFLGLIIGASKGQGLAGLILGALLGIIGLVIIAVMKPPEEPQPAGTPPGWWPDPYRAHELRYYDGGAWTAHVSDRGATSIDPR